MIFSSVVPLPLNGENEIRDYILIYTSHYILYKTNKYYIVENRLEDTVGVFKSYENCAL